VLREEDLCQDVGRCVGGTFLRVTHLPSGISRTKGPLGGEKMWAVRKRFLREIEQELVERGLFHHVVPAYRLRKRDR
jgi:hypothetical protein